MKRDYQPTLKLLGQLHKTASGRQAQMWYGDKLTALQKKLGLPRVVGALTEPLGQWDSFF